MDQINLLPWREQARQVKRTEFLITLGFFIGLTLVLVFILHLYLSMLVCHQMDRNQYLQSELDKNQGEVTTLKEKKKEVLALRAQLQFLKELRGKSYRAVRILNMLTTAVPQSLSLEKVIRNGNSVMIEGVAQSDLEVTLFMKNISTTHGFAQPVLTGINTEKTDTQGQRHFQLTVQQQD